MSPTFTHEQNLQKFSDTLDDVRLTPFGKAFALNACLNEILTSAVQPEFLTACLNLEGLSLRAEPQTPGCAVIHELDVCVLKLNDFSAVNTNQVVVGRTLDEVGVIGFLVVPQIDLME